MVSKNTAGLSEAIYRLETCERFLLSPGALLLSGLAWQRLGDRIKALARLEKAKELDPTNQIIEQHLKKIRS